MLYKTGLIKSYGIVCLLAVISCANRQTAVAKLLSNSANGLLQVKTTNRRSILMEVLPNNIHTGYSNKNGLLLVKLSLKSTVRIKDNAVIRYLNFGILQSIYMVEGADTLHCTVCERIPGITENEFLYLVIFNGIQPENKPDPTLRLLVADTIAGFGTTVFDIKRDALQKLEAIK